MENRFHAIMFHYLHKNNNNNIMVGSISQTELEKIIIFLGEKLISADIWYDKFLSKTLTNEICFTFDDCLKCHYDIALPILEKYNIKAFFFIHTCVFDMKDKLNIYSYFRNCYYDEINIFYKEFYNKLKTKFNYKHLDYLDNARNYLNKFSFYTNEDRLFRYIRDNIISIEEYDIIMNKLILDKNIDIIDLYKKINMDENDISILHKKGHIIGLHSHSHLINMDKLNYDIQKKEYEKNYKILQKLGIKCDVVAYPCGRYNNFTIQVLEKLKISLGFISKINDKKYTDFSISRIDSTNLIKYINIL